ncbi:MAG: thioredoxin family protein [Vicinamibacterales bacterium]
MLNPAERETVRARLAALIHPVRLVLFTQTFGAPESAAQAEQILREVSTLNDLVTVDVANFVLEQERAALFGITGIPGIAVLRGDADTRMRFLGAPTGYEFMSLLESILVAGTDKAGLSEESLVLIGSVTDKLDIKVFVTPTCVYCPGAVTMAHRIAHANPLITATCIEATDFLDLSRRFKVTGVPKTVVNDTIEIMGVMPEREYVRAVLNLPDTGGSPVSA